MKEYLNYLINNIKKGNYTTGILIIITLIIYGIIFSIGLIYNKIYINILSSLWLLIGSGICISWNNFWYDKNKN